MAGITLTIDDANVLETLTQLQQRVLNMQPVFEDIGEYLLREAWPRRFLEKTDPVTGKFWHRLSPSYEKTKPRKKYHILELYDHLKDTPRYQVSRTGVRFGTNRVQAAALHYGIDKNVQVSSFISKRKRKVGMVYFTVKAHTRHMKMEPRPFVGLDQKDKRNVISLVKEHIFAATGGKW